MEKYRVGVLGATGYVGQRFISLLCGNEGVKEPHPWFELVAVGASIRSAGKTYFEAVSWKLSEKLPNTAKVLEVLPCEAKHFLAAKCDLVFSGLDASVAGEVEEEFASSGIPIFSNSKNHRMDRHVPILLPQVNPKHIEAVRKQPYFEKNGGFIVTNPNCSSAGLCCALVPLFKRFGISEGIIATMQAASGAGIPGLSFIDLNDNVIPFINGEEEKVEVEPRKIFGTYDEKEGFVEAGFGLAAHCHRVAVSDGHQISVSIRFPEKSKVGLSKSELAEICKKEIENFVTEPTVALLPSHSLLQLRTEVDRPQPRLDRVECGGFATTIGRVRPCPVFDVRFTCLSHNTIAGGAGGSIFNAELAVAKILKSKSCVKALL